MIWRLVAITMLLLIAPPAMAADTWTHPFVGVEVLHRTTSSPSRNIWAVRIDLDAPGVRMLATVTTRIFRLRMSLSVSTSAEMSKKSRRHSR